MHHREFPAKSAGVIRCVNRRDFCDRGGQADIPILHGRLANIIQTVNYDGMRKDISDLGFESQDHAGLEKANTYVEKSTGKVKSGK